MQLLYPLQRLLNNMKRLQSSPPPISLVLNERLRQAKWSFNLSFFMATQCGIVILIGLGLSISGNLPNGFTTTFAALFSSLPWVYLAKDANDRLDKLMNDLKQLHNEPAQ